MRAFGGLLLAVALNGCSLLLDPEVCSSNDECGALAVCTDGVCVGPREETSGETDGDSSDAGDAGPDADETPDTGEQPDMPVPDAGEMVDVAADQGPDQAPDVPASAAPICEIRAPRTEDERITNAAEVPYEFVASDDALVSITFAGEEIDVDAEATTYSGSLALDEGEHELVLVAEDIDGQSCRESVTVVVDRTPPEVELVDPLDTTIYTNRTPYVVEGSAVDPQFSRRGMAVTVDGEAVEQLEAAWNGEDFSVAVPVGQGENTICVSLTDDADNTSEPQCLTVVFDDEPPTIRFTSPEDGSESGDSRIAVTGIVEDGGEPLANVRVDLSSVFEDGQENDVRLDPQTGDDGTFESDRVILDLGTNTVRATVRDRANNVATAEISVELLSSQPCANFDEHPEFIMADRIQLTGSFCPATDAISLQVGEEDPVAAVLDADALTWAAEIPLPGAGRHTITATASTGAVMATEETEVVVDVTPPRVVIQRPGDGDGVNDETIQVCGRVTDFDSGVSQVFVNGQDVEDIDPNNGAFCTDVNIDEGDDVTILVRAANGAGAIADAEVEIRVDREAPSILLDTEPNAWVGLDGTGRVRLTGRVDSGTCGLLRLTLDGSAIGVDPQGRWTVPLRLDEADHFVEFRAVDIAGNERVLNYGFRVDASDPEVDALIPGAEIITADAQIRVGATVCDARSGVTVTTVDGREAVPLFDGECATFDLPIDVPEGITRVPIHVEDQVGNSVDTEVVISRDVTGPTIEITWPMEGASVASSVNVEGTVDDGELGSGVAFVTVNDVRADFDEEQGTWRAVGIPVGAGEQTLTVVATDRANNTTDPAMERLVNVLDWHAEAQDQDGFGTAESVAWVGIVDADGDDRLDVVAATGDPDGTSALYVQKADGAFLPRTSEVSGVPSEAPWVDGLQGDYDADGIIDLVLAGNNRNAAFTGNGGDGYVPTDQSNIPNGMVVTGTAQGDANRDGNLDLLFFAGAGTRFMQGNGDGTFQRVPLADLGLGSLPAYTVGALVDLDDDGVQDLVAFGPEGSEYFAGQVQGGFVGGDVFGFGGLGGTFVAPLDANADGRLDVVSLGVEGALFHLSNGDGGFPTAALGLEWNPGEYQAAVVLDFDGDARDDLVLYGTAGLAFWRNGVEGFVLVDPAGVPEDIGAVTTAVAVDIERDGDVDLVYGAADGVRTLRSNLTAVDEGYRFVHLDVLRAQDDNGQLVGPRDGVGALLFQDLDGDLNADRVLVPAASFTTVMTLAGNDLANATCKYVDLGAVGNRLRDIVELAESRRANVLARE